MNSKRISAKIANIFPAAYYPIAISPTYFNYIAFHKISILVCVIWYVSASIYTRIAGLLQPAAEQIFSISRIRENRDKYLTVLGVKFKLS